MSKQIGTKYKIKIGYKKYNNDIVIDNSDECFKELDSDINSTLDSELSTWRILDAFIGIEKLKEFIEYARRDKELPYSNKSIKIFNGDKLLTQYSLLNKLLMSNEYVIGCDEIININEVDNNDEEYRKVYEVKFSIFCFSKNENITYFIDNKE